jgi:tetratricopeptide (TPR) repeat protein
MLGTKMKVGSLEEDLKEVGLDAGKVLGEIDRVTGRLSEARTNPGAGGPPVPGAAPARSVENRGLYEGRQTPGSRPSSASAPARAGGKALTLAEQARRELSADGTDPAANQAEAFRAIKKKRKSAAMKLAARLYRKGKKATLRVASRMYRKRNKRKILLRAKKKLKKFGAKMLSKLHKAGKRIMMQHADTALANLREDLNTGGNADEAVNSYEEAAFNSGMLAMHLGEVFEALGDKESAETMYSLSDIASDLSEDLDKVGEADLSEGQEEKLRRVLDQTVKALRVWEGFGSPTLFQAITAANQAVEG